MINLDKIRIVSNPNNIHDIQREKFSIITKGTSQSAITYNQTNPSLFIKVDYEKNELVIEFTGKILGKDYPKLINISTIKQCFENINEMGICRLDIDNIMNDAKVVKCDVTEDIYVDNISALTDYISSHINNYREYIVQKLRNGNLIIMKNATSKSYKKRITIYDKEKEMNKAENTRFMDKYNINKIDFNNRCRFEINLNSVKQIKDTLKIQSTSIMDVLKTKATPISDFIDEILDNPLPYNYDATRDYIPHQEYLQMLFIRECHYDPKEMESKIRTQFPKNYSIKRKMRPYLALMDKMKSHGENQITKKMIIDKLNGNLSN